MPRAAKVLRDGARVILGQDRPTRNAEGSAEVVNHGGDQRTTHDAATDKGGKGGSKGRTKAKAATGDPRGLPPGSSPQKEALSFNRRTVWRRDDRGHSSVVTPRHADPFSLSLFEIAVWRQTHGDLFGRSIMGNSSLQSSGSSYQSRSQAMIRAQAVTSNSR